MYRRKEVVEVMFVTDDTFDAPHPNEDHMTGLLFDPQTRTVELDNPCDPDERFAAIGDVIVRHEGGWDSVWDAEAFKNGFEPIETEDLISGWECLACGEVGDIAYIDHLQSAHPLPLTQ